MDYAFVPRTTPWELNCRVAMESRPNTRVLPANLTMTVPTSMLQTVHDFIVEMEALPAPADNLLLFGHGNRPCDPQ